MKKKNLVITIISVISVLVISSLIILFTVILPYIEDLEGGTSKQYQHDADIVRLNHLKTTVGYIEEYKEKTGYYPFTEKTEDGVMNFTTIATEDQINQVRDQIPFEHTTSTKQELEDELSRVLGKNIILPHDPQQRQNNARPLVYIYAKGLGDYYYFSVMTHNEYDFTRNIMDFYNVLEVSNDPDSEQNVKTYKELLKDGKFLEVINTNLYKEGYFNY